ncbi:hypothetical protein HDV01_001787 [Terramyces sp. JEL0728]|nr:hypothetical protein HDV01_001787 [Terramyces sp. JEL0728]
MAKKGKKGGKRPKSKKGKETAIPAGKVNEFLTVIKIEASKLSMAHFRHQYLKIKEEMKISRDVFTKLEQNQFRNINVVLTDMDEADLKRKEMSKLDIKMQKEMANQMDNESRLQQSRMKDLQLVIDRLERDLDSKADDLNGLAEFRTKSEQQLNEIIQEWKDRQAAAVKDHEIAMKKLLSRHETCVHNNNIRAERIINAAEGVASGRELERMSEIAFEEERLHVRLKEQIELLKSDQKKLRSMVGQMEQANMELIKHNLSIDYDLQFLEEQDEISVIDSMKEKIPGLPPLKEEWKRKFKTVKIDVPNKETANEIVVLEMVKRKKENMGISGTKASLQPPADLGPTRYYSPLNQTPLKSV